MDDVGWMMDDVGCMMLDGGGMMEDVGWMMDDVRWRMDDVTFPYYLHQVSCICVQVPSLTLHSHHVLMYIASRPNNHFYVEVLSSRGFLLLLSILQTT